MKIIIITLMSGLIVACSSTPVVQTPPPQPLQNADIVVDKVAYPLSRTETVNASQECETGGMRPVVVTAKRRVGTTVSEIVIDVYCAPRYKIFLN